MFYTVVAIVAVLGTTILFWKNRRDFQKYLTRQALVRLLKQAPIATVALEHLLVPGALMVIYWLVLYVPDQSAALRRALGSAFFLTGNNRIRGIGFQASYFQSIVWLAINAVFLVSVWLYHRFTVENESKVAEATGVAKPQLDRVTLTVGGLLISVAAEVLFVGPLVSSPRVALSTLFFAIVLSIVSIALTRAAFLKDARYAFPSLAGLLALVSFFTLLGNWIVPFVAIPVVLAASMAWWLKSKRRHSLRQSLDASLAYLGAMSALIFSVELLSLQPSENGATVAGALWLTAVWLSPAVLSALLLRLSQTETEFRWKWIAAAQVVLAVAAYFGFLAWNGAVALTSIPLLLWLATSVLLAVKMLGHRTRHIVAWGGLVVAVLAGIAFGHLLPQTRNENAPQPTASAGPADDFSAYYTAWKKLHRTDEPIILVAAAGGGVRAAQHVADSLAYTDDYTNGAFGEHVFAISAVSGGALGALVWHSARQENLFPSYDRIPKAHRFDNGAVVNRFFSNDLLSPSANKLVLHDLPYAALPWKTPPAQRDTALFDTWIAGWRATERAKVGAVADGGQFTSRFVMDPKNYGRMPILIFNSTSAADGKLTLRSNVPVMNAGDRVLSPNVESARAAMESALFPFVSAVGYGCSNEPATGTIPLKQKDCSKEPLYPHAVAITDGGYADNSGLGALSELMNKLLAAGADKNNIYVVFISSNPEDGRAYVGGSLYDSSSLTGTVFAPMLMMDSARAGRAMANRRSAVTMVAKDHFIEWSLADTVKEGIPDVVIAHTMQADAGPKATTGKSGDAASATASADAGDIQQGKQDAKYAAQTAQIMPPLGWTLDATAAQGISLVSESHAFFMNQDCQARLEAAHLLCKALVAR